MPRILNGIYSYRHSQRENCKKEGGSKKFRQEDLAEFLNVPRSRISMIENGRILPTPSELQKIAEYLEVTTGHLYSRAVLTAIHEIGEGDDDR